MIAEKVQTVLKPCTFMGIAEAWWSQGRVSGKEEMWTFKRICLLSAPQRLAHKTLPEKLIVHETVQSLCGLIGRAERPLGLYDVEGQGSALVASPKRD